LSDCEVIFNLAGKSGAAWSNAFPLEDLEVNAKGHLTFLEICRRINPAAKIIFPSSRLVYKPTENRPVPESAPLGPRSIYGIHKLAGENYHLLYSYLHDMRTTVLRITNPYGPFQRPDQSSYGIVNWFIYLALNGKSLPVYGDGSQLRDYIHVDDVVRVFLLCGMKEAADGKIFNIGGGQPVGLGYMANLVVRLANSGRVKYQNWPTSAAKTETGNFVPDISAVKQVMGWAPRFTLEAGLLDVIEQYRSFAATYCAKGNGFS
jgi:UDP-glucose 4-epimerase